MFWILHCWLYLEEAINVHKIYLIIKFVIKVRIYRAINQSWQLGLIEFQKIKREILEIVS